MKVVLNIWPAVISKVQPKLDEHDSKIRQQQQMLHVRIQAARSRNATKQEEQAAPTFATDIPKAQHWPTHTQQILKTN